MVESCKTGSQLEAEAYLNHRLEEIRQLMVYGIRPKVTFSEAAVKYVEENLHLRDIANTVSVLDQIMPLVGDLPLQLVNNETLKPMIKARKAAGVKNKTVNNSLIIIRRILNLAHRSWHVENGLSWLAAVPLIHLLDTSDSKRARPLTWMEQERLFGELPDYLREMALFKVNTGTREQEVCHLRWEWEHRVHGTEHSVFVIPAERVKNKTARLVVLNSVARSVVNDQRGKNPKVVFPYRDKQLSEMGNTAWNKARVRAETPWARVHDLKHTFASRLRAAGVPEETRRDLLGHKFGRSMTAHYSAAQISELIVASEKATNREIESLTLIQIMGNESETDEKEKMECREKVPQKSRTWISR